MNISGSTVSSVIHKYLNKEGGLMCNITPNLHTCFFFLSHTDEVHLWYYACEILYIVVCNNLTTHIKYTLNAHKIHT